MDRNELAQMKNDAAQMKETAARLDDRIAAMEAAMETAMAARLDDRIAAMEAEIALQDGLTAQEEEVVELRKAIVNMMSLKQAKSILDPAEVKHKDCKTRGDCDTEGTVLERLWGFIEKDGWKDKYRCM
jgi:hypothetical protein